MSLITVYKYDAGGNKPAPYDVKATDNPLVAEKRYLKRCLDRTDDDIRLVVQSEHPMVPSAEFSLKEGDATNFHRESNSRRKYSLWGTPELSWVNRGKDWEAPTCFQVKAIKECMLQDAGGEISTQLLAMKAHYHKRTFNHYFSEKSEKDIPFIVLRFMMELAKLPVEPIGVEPVLRGEG